VDTHAFEGLQGGKALYREQEGTRELNGGGEIGLAIKDSGFDDAGDFSEGRRAGIGRGDELGDSAANSNECAWEDVRGRRRAEEDEQAFTGAGIGVGPFRRRLDVEARRTKRRDETRGGDDAAFKRRSG